MRRLLMTGAAVLATLAISSPVSAGWPAIKGLYGPIATYPGCPNQATALLDGCALANQNSDFTVQGKYGTDCHDHFIQSGQTWANGDAHHPWPWNAPGCDYPVGRDKTLTLVDVATAPIGTGNGKMPPNCAYSATGTGSPNFKPEVFCGPPHTVGSFTISGLDFGPASANGSVILRICENSPSYTVVVQNNNFGHDANTDVANTQFVSSCNAYKNALTVQYNDFDLGGVTSNLASAIGLSSTSPAIVQFNAFLNVPAQLITAGGDAATAYIQYNYVDGLSENHSTPLHGAMLEKLALGDLSGGVGGDQGPQIERYNTLVMPTATGQGNTTVFSFLGSASSTLEHHVSLGVVSHNLLVINCYTTASNGQCPHTSAVMGAALTYPFRLSSIQSFSVDNNYVDPHGAYNCLASSGTVVQLVGKVDNNGGGVAGNTMTITGGSPTPGSAGGLIYPYQFIIGNAAFGVSSSDPSTTPYVMPYHSSCDGAVSSGSGGNGTYCIANSIGSKWLLSPFPAGVETANVPINPSAGHPLDMTFMNNNIEMESGQTITASGVQFGAGNCPNHTL